MLLCNSLITVMQTSLAKQAAHRMQICALGGRPDQYKGDSILLIVGMSHKEDF